MAGVATYRGMEAALNGANFRQTVTAAINGAGEGLGLFRNPTSITSLLTQGPQTNGVNAQGLEAIKFTLMTFGLDFVSSDIISRQIGAVLTKNNTNTGINSNKFSFKDTLFNFAVEMNARLVDFSYDTGIATRVIDFFTGIPDFVRSVSSPDASITSNLFAIGKLEIDLLGEKMITETSNALKLYGASKVGNVFAPWSRAYRYGEKIEKEGQRLYRTYEFYGAMVDYQDRK